MSEIDPSVKLLPCPFCGSRPDHIWQRNDDYSVCCGRCNATGPLGDDDERMYELWNRRHHISDPLRSPQYAADDLKGVFGMCEMELAAARIVKKCQQARGWVSVAPYEFRDDDHALTGFCALVAHGWLILDHPNECYEITSEFIQRVTDA